MGYFLSGLPHYFFGYLELSFSNFWPQVQMCWGRPQGSVRSQKSAMWPTFCLACLFVFVTSSPTFQVSGHRFFGVVSRVISELRSTARWQECRRQGDNYGMDGRSIVSPHNNSKYERSHSAITGPLYWQTIH